MRNKFDRQLQILEEQLIHMGELCESAIANATKALSDGSIEQAKAVINADAEIDEMEKDIEKLCLKLLLQQQPVAKDLRRISAALKMMVPRTTCPILTISLTVDWSAILGVSRILSSRSTCPSSTSSESSLSSFFASLMIQSDTGKSRIVVPILKIV